MRRHYLICPVQLKISERRWKIDADACKVSGKKRRESNHQPFRQIERLKENLFHQLERFTKRFEDFDFRLRSIHKGDLASPRPRQSIPKAPAQPARRGGRKPSEFGAKRLVAAAFPS